MELNEKLKNKEMLYEVEYTLLNDSGGVSGDVVYIENYESATLNETDGRIHLIEIDQNDCDDVFKSKINKIIEYNGTAYIAIVTNPSFINKKNTSIPGIAISRYSGEKIKNSLEDKGNVSVRIESDQVLDNGILEVFCPDDMSCQYDYIYLIDLNKVKNSWFRTRYLGIVKCIYIRSFFSCYPMKAFLISDLNSDTHHMYPSFGLQGDPRFSSTTIKRSVDIPGFCINGTLGYKINEGDTVDFKIISSHEEKAVSYNVIGTIDGSSDDVVIVSAHYDSYWGQCAMDDAAAVGAIWGVAKYIKDNGITPYYTLKFIAFGGEEYGVRGSRHYVWKHLLQDEPDETVVAVINLDPTSMKTKNIDPDDPPIPLTPWIYPGDGTYAYDKILEAMKLEQYKKITGYNYIKPDDAKKDGEIAGGDLGQFMDKEGNLLADYFIEIERMVDYKKGAEDLAFFDHRSGENFQTGDVWSKVDTKDLFEMAKMTLRLVQLIAISADLTFENECTFTQLDLDSDGNYDSVKIGYDVFTNISTGGKVESVIYQNGQVQSTIFTTNLLNLTQNLTTSGNLTVTLPPNVSAGNYDIRVYLKDFNGSQDDFDNSTIYLYPYNHSIANFTWVLNDSNLKMVNFTDMSMPSPNATLSSWNWSFGDGNYSNLQNCSHNYSDVGIFNVTLIVTDSANKSSNITKQVQTFNTEPVAIFNANATLVMLNESLTFNSTSYDVDGRIVNTTWYFGDNSTGFGSDITHSFSKSGYYTVGVAVTDNDNITKSTWIADYILVVDAMVDDGFTDNPGKHEWNSIQEGINDVNDNDTIYVYNGSYNPYLVNKSVSIYGENKNGVLISATDIGIDIQSHDIHIKNFTINGGTTGVKITSTVNGTGNITIENGYIPGPLTYGVYIDNSSNNTIKDCEIEKADAGVKICNGAMYNVIDDCDIEGCYNGVGIYSSNFNWVGDPSIYDWHPNDCTFKLNTNAVYLDESDHNYILGCNIDADSPLPFGTYRGIFLDEASNTTISTCDIYEGTQGIYIKDSRDSKIEFCRIKGNQMGIEFYGLDAKDNLIVQNNITGNTQFGIFIPAEPSNNSIYYNDFIGNVNPGTVNQSHDDRGIGQMNIWEKSGNNTLTKTGNGEGNYWDDYTGSDLDSDGIGDTPYELDTINERIIKDDDYPVMTAYSWCTGTGWD